MGKFKNQFNLDANETMFFERQLESIKARTYDVLYPEFTAQRMIPVSMDAGPGAASITYRQYDRVGMMKFIASYADDLPRSDVKGKEFTTPVRSVGGAYGYNLDEIRYAARAGVPLEQRKANSARQSWEEIVNRTAWLADGSEDYASLYGLLYQANITTNNAPTGNWIAGVATPDQIIGDVNYAINQVRVLTNGVEMVDTVCLPIEEYAHIASTPRSSTSDTTILEFLRRVHPGVMFEQLIECADLAPLPSGGAGPGNIILAYRRSPDKLTLEIPQLFEQLPVQARNLEFVVPTHGRLGGVIVYYPLSVHVVEGI